MRVPILTHMTAIDTELAGRDADSPDRPQDPMLRQSLAGVEAGTGRASPVRGLRLRPARDLPFIPGNSRPVRTVSDAILTFCLQCGWAWLGR